jgi:hypothetical protein
MTETLARNATLADLAEMLKRQLPRKIDVVAAASNMFMEGGMLRISGTDAQLDADGVTSTVGHYRPATIFDEGVAEKLRIPLTFLRRLRNERVGLYDAVINGLLNGYLHFDECLEAANVGDPDPRAFLVRCLRPDDEEEGIARAFLSDKFKAFDNYDAVAAALKGVEEAGVEVAIQSCDLTERRVVVRVVAPQVMRYSPQLLAGYRNPMTGQTGAPIIFAGFEVSNSEVGEGAYSIVPRMVVEVCSNGWKITKDAHRAVHIGGRLEEGIIEWSADTTEKAAELIVARARDAVKAFLNVEYMETVLGAMERQAEAPVDSTTVVTNVGKKLGLSQQTIDGVFDHFIRAGQITAGGVLQAITSYAQTVDDADQAFTLEGVAVQAMALAASGR